MRVLLELDVLSREEHPFPFGHHHSSIIELAMVKVYHYLLLRSIDHPVEAFEREADVKIVAPRVSDFIVNNMEDVLLVFGSGGEVVPLKLVEGSIGPVGLGAGTDLAVSAGNDEVGRLNCHLINVLVIELKYIWFFGGQMIDSFTY
jgi:hypothetical protein